MLGDGQVRSGRQLADVLGVSRTSVWNQIKILKSLGLPIQAVPGQGYCLAQRVDTLDEEQTLAHLPDRMRRRIGSVDWFDRVDSTSDHLLRHLTGATDRVAICIAESQSAGRGRRGRSWVSPFGCNIYFSVAYPFAAGVSGLIGLTPALGVALARTLTGMGVAGIRVKWPNDLLLEQRKAAGILVDIRGDAAGPCWAIVGIGVNLAMPGAAGRTVDQPWANIAPRLAPGVTRTECLGRLLSSVLCGLETIETRGPDSYLVDWPRFDALRGKTVMVDGHGEAITGVAEGIAGNGMLRVVTQAGERLVMAGEVSVRNVPGTAG